tara:strand:- start:313 stop:435 length:123 start_codon:yes stop_codon:yes gene_type:complete
MVVVLPVRMEALAVEAVAREVLGLVEQLHILGKVMLEDRE